jgi:phage baseplate assembly protein W
MIITPTTRKQDVLYSDLRKDMFLNPVNSDVSRYTDEDAIKESIKNLLLTDQGERLFNPTLGSNIRKMLFENILYPETKYILNETISTTIRNFEPRCNLISVNISDMMDDSNSVTITITFSVINIQTPITLNVVLSRVR